MAEQYQPTNYDSQIREQLELQEQARWDGNAIKYDAATEKLGQILTTQAFYDHHRNSSQEKIEITEADIDPREKLETAIVQQKEAWHKGGQDLEIANQHVAQAMQDFMTSDR